MDSNTTGIRIEVAQVGGGPQPGGGAAPAAPAGGQRVNYLGVPDAGGQFQLEESYQQIMDRLRSEDRAARKAARGYDRVRLRDRSASGGHERAEADEEDDRLAERRGREKAEGRKNFIAEMRRKEQLQLRKESEAAAQQALKAFQKKAADEYKERKKKADQEAKENERLNNPNRGRGGVRLPGGGVWGGLRYSLGSNIGGYTGSRLGYRLGGHLGGLAGMYAGRRLGLRAQRFVTTGLSSLSTGAKVAGGALVAVALAGKFAVETWQWSQKVLKEEAERVRYLSPALQFQSVTNKLRDMTTDFTIAAQFGDRMAQIADRENRSENAGRLISAKMAGAIDNMTKDWLDPIWETWVEIKEWMAGVHDVSEENRKILTDMLGVSKEQLEEMGIKGSLQNNLAFAATRAQQAIAMLGGKGLGAFQGAAPGGDIPQAALDNAVLDGPDRASRPLIGAPDHWRDQIRWRGQ
jgi:hypothetical protein